MLLQRTMNRNLKPRLINTHTSLFDFGKKQGPTQEEIERHKFERSVSNFFNNLTKSKKEKDYIAQNPEFANKYLEVISSQFDSKIQKATDFQNQRLNLIRTKNVRNHAENLQRIKNKSEEMLFVCTCFTLH